VTEVMFKRLTGAALMSKPLMITVCSRYAGRLNSETPISLNECVPGGGADAGMSLAAGALALLGTGSVAFTSVHVFGEASFRQPVALTISTFFDEDGACASASPSTNTRVVMARMIPLVAADRPLPSWRRCVRCWRLPGGSNARPRTQENKASLRALRSLRSILPAVAILSLSLGAVLTAHDLERTNVLLTFENDGSFTLDVANDPSWLKLRLEDFPGPFPDRVVMWVDGREVRPASVEFIPGTPAAIHRMRGRMPRDARTLRWYYGLVIDPYPLTVRRADGKVTVEEVQGDAWSREIDLSGQFPAPILSSTVVGIALVILLALPVALRIGSARTKDTKATKDTEERAAEAKR
jgi:hypothetical protein